MVLRTRSSNCKASLNCRSADVPDRHSPPATKSVCRIASAELGRADVGRHRVSKPQPFALADLRWQNSLPHHLLDVNALAWAGVRRHAEAVNARTREDSVAHSQCASYKRSIALRDERIRCVAGRAHIISSAVPPPPPHNVARTRSVNLEARRSRSPRQDRFHGFGGNSRQLRQGVAPWHT